MVPTGDLKMGEIHATRSTIAGFRHIQKSHAIRGKEGGLPFFFSPPSSLGVRLASAVAGDDSTAGADPPGGWPRASRMCPVLGRYYCKETQYHQLPRPFMVQIIRNLKFCRDCGSVSFMFEVLCRESGKTGEIELIELGCPSSLFPSLRSTPPSLIELAIRHWTSIGISDQFLGRRRGGGLRLSPFAP